MSAKVKTDPRGPGALTLVYNLDGDGACYIHAGGVRIGQLMLGNAPCVIKRLPTDSMSETELAIVAREEKIAAEVAVQCRQAAIDALLAREELTEEELLLE